MTDSTNSKLLLERVSGIQCATSYSNLADFSCRCRGAASPSQVRAKKKQTAPGLHQRLSDYLASQQPQINNSQVAKACSSFRSTKRFIMVTGEAWARDRYCTVYRDEGWKNNVILCRQNVNVVYTNLKMYHPLQVFPLPVTRTGPTKVKSVVLKKDEYALSIQELFHDSYMIATVVEAMPTIYSIFIQLQLQTFVLWQELVIRIRYRIRNIYTVHTNSRWFFFWRNEFRWWALFTPKNWFTQKFSGRCPFNRVMYFRQVSL